jgi:hypothetical protein
MQSELYILSDFENWGLQYTPDSDPPFNGSKDPYHTLPCEQDGMSMLDLAHAMQSDAASQVRMLPLLCDRLDEIVHINDQRQVRFKTLFMRFKMNRTLIMKCTESVSVMLRREKIAYRPFEICPTHHEVWTR